MTIPRSIARDPHKSAVRGDVILISPTPPLLTLPTNLCSRERDISEKESLRELRDIMVQSQFIYRYYNLLKYHGRSNDN